MDSTYLAMVFNSASFSRDERSGIERIAAWVTRVQENKVGLKTDAQRAFYAAYRDKQYELPTKFRGSTVEQHYVLWRRFMEADNAFREKWKQEEERNIERHEKAKREEPMRQQAQLKAMLAKANRPAPSLSQEERAVKFRELNKSDVDFNVSPYLTRGDDFRKAKQQIDEVSD